MIKDFHFLGMQISTSKRADIKYNKRKYNIIMGYLLK